MGRELRRKQAKREGKSLKKEELQESHELKNYLRITIILVLIILVLYIFSGLFFTKELKKPNKENQNNISNSIIAKSIFNQSEEEYYVYFYDFTNEDSNISETINSKLSNKKIYRVDTSSALNANYVSESSNKNAKTLDELQVLSPTVIKISGDYIIEYYEGNEILTELK